MDDTSLQSCPQSTQICLSLDWAFYVSYLPYKLMEFAVVYITIITKKLVSWSNMFLRSSLASYIMITNYVV